MTIDSIKSKLDITKLEGTTFDVILLAVKTMRAAGADHAKILQYKREVLSGDYDHVIKTTLKYVDLE